MTESLLSIGDVARATGVSEATLRVWETRHGFPQPMRLPSGHRRYAQAQVSAVLDVQRRRDAGVRLDVAIRQVLEQNDAVARPAVFARIADRHPGQPRRDLRKTTLVRLCRAIEDEVSTSAEHAHLFASFQSERHYRPARERWSELARLAASAHVFADFGDADPVEGLDGPGPVRVNLPERAPLRREWAVVCDAPELPVAMLAWEPPAHAGGPDGERVLEVMWSVDPLVVRDAARWCAEAAAGAGSTRAAELLAGPLSGDPPERTDPRLPLALDRLLLRILGSLDDSSAHSRGR